MAKSLNIIYHFITAKLPAIVVILLDDNILEGRLSIRSENKDC